jgi:hypothetical protein
MEKRGKDSGLWEILVMGRDFERRGKESEREMERELERRLDADDENEDNSSGGGGKKKEDKQWNGSDWLERPMMRSNRNIITAGRETGERKRRKRNNEAVDECVEEGKDE